MDNTDARIGSPRSGCDPSLPLPPSGVWSAPPIKPPKKRDPAFWAGTKVSLLFLGAFLASVILSVLLLAGAALWDGFSNIGYLGGGGSLDWLLYGDVGQQVMTLILYAIPFILAGVLFMVVTRIPWKTAVPGNRVPAGEFLMSVWVILFFGTVGSYFTPIVERVLRFFGMEPAELGFELPATLPGILLFGVTIAILPPLLEEFLLRGLALQTLRPLGSGPAILLSALLFGLIHGTVQQMHLAVFMGLAAAFFTVKYNNIWIGVVAHFINNGAAFVLSLLDRYLAPEWSYLASMMTEYLFVLPGIVCIVILYLKKGPQFLRFDDAPSLPRGLPGVVLNPAAIILILVYAGILLSGLRPIGG